MDMRRRPMADLGGAGLVSTVDDTLAFAMMLAGRGELGGVRILRPQTVDLMCSGQLVATLGERALARSILGERGLGMDTGPGGAGDLRQPAQRPCGGSGHGDVQRGDRRALLGDPKANIAGSFMTHAMNGGLAEFSRFERLAYAALD